MMKATTATTVYLIVVPRSGTLAARYIDPGSAIVCEAFDAANVLVYFEGNRYHAANLTDFKTRVQCAAGRLWRKYPTVARGTYARDNFQVIGTFTFTDDWRTDELQIEDQHRLTAWLLLKPEIFKQKIPCTDCPFRKEGGVRHGREMMQSYIDHFTRMPGATFPCHKSVPKTDTREDWSPWQDGQVLCAGGLIFAAKVERGNAITKAGKANGWYDPAQHTPEERATVFDSEAEMLGDE